MLLGAGGRYGDADPEEPDERADFEQLQPDRAARGISELGTRFSLSPRAQ
jgi:hypothetical protein